MELLRKIAGAVLAAALAFPVAAADTTLLIQIQPDGRYKVWHADGTSPLYDNEILALEASASQEGGRSMLTAAGLARAIETGNGVLIQFPALGPDKTLLIDRDGCGGIKVWHSVGTIAPTEKELTELVLTALPDGGKRISIGEHYAKAYTTTIGVVVVVWKPVARRPPP